MLLRLLIGPCGMISSFNNFLKATFTTFNWTLWNDKPDNDDGKEYVLSLLIGPCGMISNNTLIDKNF